MARFSNEAAVIKAAEFLQDLLPLLEKMDALTAKMDEMVDSLSGVTTQLGELNTSLVTLNDLLDVRLPSSLAGNRLRVALL